MSTTKGGKAAEKTDDATKPTGYKKNPDNSVEWELRDGRKIKIIEGNGAICRKATRGLSDTDRLDETVYISRLMAACTTINGEEISMDDLDKLPMFEYFTFQTEFHAINF